MCYLIVGRKRKVLPGGQYLSMEIIRRKHEGNFQGPLIINSSSTISGQNRIPWYSNAFARYSLFSSISNSKYKMFRWVPEDIVIPSGTSEVNIAAIFGPEHSGQGSGPRTGSNGLSQFDQFELDAAQNYTKAYFQSKNVKGINILQSVFYFILTFFKRYP